MIKSKNITKHATEERAERISFIATKMSFGTPIAKEVKKENHTLKTLTDTGIMIITDLTDTTRIVTMYPATVEQAKRILKTNNLPHSLYSNIKTNQKLVDKHYTSKGKKF